MYEISVNGKGSTSNGEHLIKHMDLEGVTKVIVKLMAHPPGGVADVTFVFNDGFNLTISDSFGMGYRGTGPYGLYCILINRLGVPSVDAEKLFIPDTYELTFDITK